ncbi:MAG: hypothetical protein JWN74_2196 [Acidobacteriaceae bacterium]|nr:hypothetical protein [Acidobacteriaceae bacterium]
MPKLGSSASPDSMRTAYFGLAIFLFSFFLPAVGSLIGFQCAFWALTSWNHQDKISSLALFGGWLNPMVLVLFFLSIFRRAPRIRSVLTVTILFSIPMTWIAIYRMAVVGMYMDLDVGHFLWIAGILVIALPNVRPAFSFSLARWLAGGAASVIAFLSVPLLIALTMRPASELDDFFYVVAWTLKEPSICGKISANAIGRPDQRDSTDFTYMQSDCYRNIAAMLHAPDLCSHVKSASIDRLIGSPSAKLSCRKQQYTLGTAMPGTEPNLIGTMRSMGLGDEQLAEFLYEERPDNYLDPVLKILRNDPAFLSRLTAAPNYDEPFRLENRRSAHSLEFLDDIIAIQSDIPSLCKKISPNAQAQDFGGHFLLRNACFSNVAFNRRDESLCGNLARAGDIQQPNHGDPSRAYEACVKTVAILRDPRTHLQSFRYPGSYFPTWPQFQEAIQQLGYPSTTPWLQLPHPVPEQYANYFLYVAQPQHVTARADFVRRVLAIQSASSLAFRQTASR